MNHTERQAANLILKLFIQGCIKLNFGLEAEFKKLLARSCDAVKKRFTVDFDLVELAEVVRAANKALHAVDLELRSIHDPESGAKYWVLANNNGDSIMRDGTKLSVDDLIGLKTLIDLIVSSQSPPFLVSSVVAIREVAKARKSSHVDTEKFIKQLTSDAWIVQRSGKYTLSLKSLVELDLYIKDTFPDNIKECAICRETCTVNCKGCSNTNCSVVLHQRCMDAVLSRSGGKCPSCNELFNL